MKFLINKEVLYFQPWTCCIISEHTFSLAFHDRDRNGWTGLVFTANLHLFAECCSWSTLKWSLPIQNCVQECPEYSSHVCYYSIHWELWNYSRLMQLKKLWVEGLDLTQWGQPSCDPETQTVGQLVWTNQLKGFYWFYMAHGSNSPAPRFLAQIQAITPCHLVSLSLERPP